MMNFKKYTLVFSLCFLACLVLEAQTGDRVKRRAENRANQRVDQKVDQAVDQAAKKIEGLFRRKKDEPQEVPTDSTAVYDSEIDTEVEEDDDQPSGGLFGGLTMGGKFEPYQNPVQMNLTMNVTTTNSRGKEEEMTIQYTFDTWATGMRIITDDEPMRILLDNEEGYMTMITTDKGQESGFRMRQQAVNYEDALPQEDSYTITDLGNERVIDGYPCREYLIEHEDGTTNAWMTTELDIDMESIARAMSTQMRQNKRSSAGTPFFGATGFPIESTTVNGKDTIVARYTNIVVGSGIDKSIFDTTGVKVTSLGY